MKDTYNGWANITTWQVSMWLRGDYGNGADDARDADIRRIARIGPSRLRDYVVDILTPDTSRAYGHGDAFGARLLLSDLIVGALTDVDWSELAVAFTAEYPS